MIVLRSIGDGHTSDMRPEGYEITKKTKAFILWRMKSEGERVCLGFDLATQRTVLQRVSACTKTMCPQTGNENNRDEVVRFICGQHTAVEGG